jgi:hypothetical protein
METLINSAVEEFGKRLTVASSSISSNNKKGNGDKAQDTSVAGIASNTNIQEYVEEIGESIVVL